MSTADGTAPRVVLIVDNPLRDLDGLVMLGRELARRGAEATLAPMYDQAFVVDAVRPQVVVANYVRPNNARLLQSYRRAGARLVVVDTEGAAGKAAEDLADLLAHTGLAELANAYCVWGRRQFEAIVAKGVLPHDQVKVTGCPRYDFVAPQWRGALPIPDASPGFVLINTNFAAIAPRFSGSAEVERETLIKLGLAAEYVDARLRDEMIARQGLIDLIRTLARRYPERDFVLRPHPFENPDPYRVLEDLSNFSVRQEGTSIEWLAAASVLIHLNCSTAVEAAMLDKPALTPAWLDTRTLEIAGPSSVSRHVEDESAMIAIVGACLAGAGLEPEQALEDAKAAIISDTYSAIDGKAASRAAEVVMSSAMRDSGSSFSRPIQGTTKERVRRALGAKLWYHLRAAYRPGLRMAYGAKALDTRKISDLVDRLNAIDPGMVASASGTDRNTAVGDAVTIRATGL